MLPKQQAQSRTYPPIRRLTDFLRLGRCRFHLAEAQFSRRTKLNRPAFWARGVSVVSFLSRRCRTSVCNSPIFLSKMNSRVFRHKRWLNTSSYFAKPRHIRPEGRIYLPLAHSPGPPCSEEQDLSIVSDRTCTFWAQDDRVFRLPSIKRLGSTHDAFRFGPLGPPADLTHDAFPCGNLPPIGSHRPRKRIFSREALLLSAPDPRPLPSLQDRCAFFPEQSPPRVVTDPGRHPPTSTYLKPLVVGMSRVLLSPLHVPPES
jgi:hypothetical protein